MERASVIINVRGTSGSGKSDLARRILELYKVRNPHFIEGRKRPLYYECERPTGRNLFVIGHYEEACGGCDTISRDQFDTVFGLVGELAQKGDVLFEGLLISAERRRSAEFFANRADAFIIALTTTLGQCISSIHARRVAKGTQESYLRTVLMKLVKQDATWGSLDPEPAIRDTILGLEAGERPIGSLLAGALFDLSIKNTADKHREVPKVAWKLEQAKATVLYLNRQDAFNFIQGALGV